MQIKGDVRGAVVSDEHVPFHDQAAIDLSNKILAWWQPDVLILNGDQLDFYDLSDFDKDPKRSETIQDEIDVWHSNVAEPQRRAVQNARVLKLKGNHEERLERFLARHGRALNGLRALEYQNLLEMQRFGIERCDDEVVLNQNLLVTHGSLVRRWAGASAQSTLAALRYGISVIVGHVHRSGFVSVRTWNGQVYGVENPCLCRLDPPYTTRPDWQLGLTLFHSTPKSLYIQPVVIDANYTTMIGDKTFTLTPKTKSILH